MVENISYLQTKVDDILDFVNKVLSNNDQKLPNEGYYAGQSLNDILLHLIDWNKHKSKPNYLIINDIDIFYEVKQKEDIMYLKANSEVDLENFGYDEIVMSQNKKAYSIVKTSVNKKLNITSVSWDINKNMTPLDIISKFDISSTQVAIDLKTKRLYVTDAYLEFLKTGQLKIEYAGSPFHSINRLVRKSIEHGFYCNFDDEIRKVYFYSIFLRHDNFMTLYFSDKQRDNFLKYEHILGKYFKLVTYAKKGDEKDYDEGAKYSHNIYTLDLINNDLIDSFSEFSENKLGPDDFDQAAYLYDLYFFKKRSRVNEFLNETKEMRSRYYDGVCMETFSLFKTLMKDPEFVLNKFRQIKKITMEHPLILHSYIRLINANKKSLSFADLYSFISEVKQLVKKRGKHVYGAIEEISFARRISEFNSIDDYVQAYEKENSGSLTEKILPDYEDEEWSIKELTTSLELKIEGSKLNHCVGGYSNSVKSKRSRIISCHNLINPRESFTVELLNINFARWNYSVLKPLLNTEEEVLSYYNAQSMAHSNCPIDKDFANALIKKAMQGKDLFNLFSNEEKKALLSSINSMDGEINDIEGLKW